MAPTTGLLYTRPGVPTLLPSVRFEGRTNNQYPVSNSLMLGGVVWCGDRALVRGIAPLFDS